MADIPSNEPLTLRAGDTWKWTRTLTDYPAGAWTLKYRFKNAAGGFELSATTSGSDHAISVSAANSALHSAGTYDWIAWVEGGSSEKYTVDSGVIQITPNYRADSGGLAALDDRSHARKMLAAIEAWLESRDVAVAEYEIAGRRMKYIPIAELIRLRQRYQQEISAQANAAAIAKGEGSGRKIQFRI